MIQTVVQAGLVNLLQELAQKEGTDLQCAMRDVLTDMRHVATALELDFDAAGVGSGEVYNEECDLAESPTHWLSVGREERERREERGEDGLCCRRNHAD